MQSLVAERHSSWLLLVLVVTISCYSNGRLQAQATDAIAVANHLDETLASEVGASEVPITGDEIYLRRVSLDIVGRPPTISEITAFALDPSADKRSRVVDRLLASDDYATNWARYYRDVIMYRRTEDRAVIVTPELEKYLTQKLAEGAPWSEIATEMITAEGEYQDNGATALIIAQQGRPEETVSEISRIFLGIQIQCAQCHDHPTDRWKREQFHELAAFFPRVAFRLIMQPERRSIAVTVNDSPAGRNFGMNNMRFRGTPEHFMPDLKDPSSQGKKMQPVFFLTGEKLPLGTKDADRRSELAAWITSKENPYFSQALVNRLWSELVGEGFYEPVDDIGPDRTATAPKTLEYLSQQFAAANYDHRWLLKTIVSTKTYQRESRSRRAPDEPPMQANVSQRLRSDQLFSSLLVALDIGEPTTGPMMQGGLYGNARSPRNLFATAFGYDPSNLRDEVQTSIPQALVMMNSPNFSRSIDSRRRTGGLGKMLAEIPENRDAVTELYLRVLARQPSLSEQQTAINYIRSVSESSRDGRGEAFEDLLWTLLNSTEFLHRR